ncbi:MAG: hypothetical protein IT458_20630 [Planctomycetes bacterium]|nr:hypothetical protein [Planctomycetota bacterium]
MDEFKNEVETLLAALRALPVRGIEFLTPLIHEGPEGGHLVLDGRDVERAEGPHRRAASDALSRLVFTRTPELARFAPGRLEALRAIVRRTESWWGPNWPLAEADVGATIEILEHVLERVAPPATAAPAAQADRLLESIQALRPRIQSEALAAEVLRALDAGPKRMADLKASLNKTDRTFRRVLADLGKHGLVETLGKGAAARRALTETGRALLADN